jgi:hypothetical protein
MTTLLAFTNTKQTKRQALATMRKHVKADQLVKGKYWEEGKGCAVGCQYHNFKANPDINSGWHELAETVHGIPRQLAYLEDRIFENLENGIAMAWPERFLSSIPTGADLSNVVPQLMLWILKDATHGVIKFAKREHTKKAIQDVIALYELKLAGKTLTEDQWRVASRAAYAAYADAADAAAAAAADAYAAYAAYADAYAAAYADAYAAAAAADAAADADAAYAAYAADAAAYAAADAAAAADAKRIFWIAIADKVIELVKAAPVST